MNIVIEEMHHFNKKLQKYCSMTKTFSTFHIKSRGYRYIQKGQSINIYHISSVLIPFYVDINDVKSPITSC